MSPILEALKAGEKFSFPLLASAIEDAEAHWQGWWEGRNLQAITRPEVIADDDPLLTETINKEFADTKTGLDFFDRYFLRRLLDCGYLPIGEQLPRSGFRDLLVNNLACVAPELEHPVVYFAGGGYGSGKTTTLDFMRNHAQFPFQSAGVLGVDCFKLYLPEFDMIRLVGDGRASSLVQREAVLMANQLFDRLVAQRRSFAWDSSMSNYPETVAKIEKLRDAGYSLKMVAVFTPLATATRQAMDRARRTRRFPNAVMLPKSHADFFAAFLGYLDYFQDIKVFYNNPPVFGAGFQDPVLLAESVASDNKLVIHDQRLFESFVSLPAP